MRIPEASLDQGTAYAVAVQKLAQDQTRREGTKIVTLIEGARPPVGPNGEGSHVNTYA